MTLDFDSYLGIHAKALVVRDLRASQLANNLANVDTPNYKAMDADFNEFLAASMNGTTPALQMTSPKHIDTHADLKMHLKYRVSAQHSLDGNTVDKDIETTEFTKNALDYQVSLSFLDNKIKSMIMAFRGE